MVNRTKNKRGDETPWVILVVAAFLGVFFGGMFFLEKSRIFALPPPSPVASAVANSIRENPEDWEQSILGVENKKLRVRVYAGAPFDDDDIPIISQFVRVYIATVSISDFENVSGRDQLSANRNVVANALNKWRSDHVAQNRLTKKSIEQILVDDLLRSH